MIWQPISWGWMFTYVHAFLHGTCCRHHVCVCGVCVCIISYFVVISLFSLISASSVIRVSFCFFFHSFTVCFVVCIWNNSASLAACWLGYRVQSQSIVFVALKGYLGPYYNIYGQCLYRVKTDLASGKDAAVLLVSKLNSCLLRSNAWVTACACWWQFCENKQRPVRQCWRSGSTGDSVNHQRFVVVLCWLDITATHAHHSMLHNHAHTQTRTHSLILL